MSINAELNINPQKITGEIDTRIYGQYLEPVEPDDRAIYGGIVDDEGELNQVVVDKLKEMGVPMIRWGGNHFDVYNWQDGVGDKSKRPTKPNYFWGGLESNKFGTDEFLKLCEILGAQPSMNINMGSGTLLEAIGWLEYCNYPGGTLYSDQRAANGRAEPWNVPIWGIGNEAWGTWEACYSTPEEYITLYNKFCEYMRRLDPNVNLVVVGHTEHDWNETILRGMRKPAEYMSLHMYGHSHIGKEGNYEQLVALPAAFDYETRAAIDDVRRYGRAPIWFALDEWNVRHFENGKLNRKSPRRLQDALFVAGVFHMMQNHSDYMKVANYVTMVNGNAPIRYWDGELFITPLYHVFKLFQDLTYGQAIETRLSAPEYSVMPFDWISAPRHKNERLTVQYVDAAATIDQAQGKVAVTLINRHKQDSANVVLTLEGNADANPSVTLLTGDDVDSLQANVANADDIATRLSDGRWQVTLPPHSLAWVNLTLTNQ